MCFHCFYSFFSSLATIVTPIASLMLAIVAFRLSRKITFKEKLKEIQFEMITDLIKNLHKQDITFLYQTEKSTKGTVGGGITLYFPHFLATNFKDKFPSLFEDPFFIEVGISEQFTSFLSPALNTGINYMPINIRDLLQRFNMRGDEVTVNISTMEKWVKLANTSYADRKNGDPRIVKSMVFTTFESFYNFVKELLLSINKWLEKHEVAEVGFDTKLTLK
jgi:hypothetical protein